ncbi:MAG: hypothetical protein AAF567_12030 [Actinomycetota bacterium]
MALYHRATIVPSKADLVATWAPTQSWYPAGEETEVVGAFRFDDPLGQVGMETHLVRAGSTLLQVPLTYRDAPLDHVADDRFVGTTEHSALGTRWVYDGLIEAPYLMMLAGAAMTGQGEALGMVDYDGRWHIAPSGVRLTGGGWGAERVAVDDFSITTETDTQTELRNDGFALTFHRQLTPLDGDRPPLGLTAAWEGQPAVLLARIRQL